MGRRDVPGYEFEPARGPRHGAGRRALDGAPADAAPDRFAGDRSEVQRSDLDRSSPMNGSAVRRPAADRSAVDRYSARRSDLDRSAGDRSAGDRFAGHDPIRALRYAGEAPREPAPPVQLAGSVLAVMRARNWVTNLLVPILAAIAVGIAVVVIAGANHGGTAQAPPALAAGFPPARPAAADFTGATVGSRVLLDAIAASGATQVAAGSADGRSALWVSADGGATWGRAAVATQPGELTGVTHGAAGWLAVGSTMAARTGRRVPVVASSPDGQTWTPVRSAAFAAPGTVVTATAAGRPGYVIVGHGAAWYAPGLTGWRRTTVPGNGTMAAVTAAGTGFAAVGATGTHPAAWLSATGRSWTLVRVPLPDGAASASLAYVAAQGRTVAAVGTEVTTAGQWRPFAAVSADAGRRWTLADLPVAGGAGTVTALATAGGGFVATGTNGAAGSEDVVVWTLPPGTPAGTAWTEAVPQGTGLSGPGTQAITALTAQGATLTGLGFTTGTTKATGTTGTTGAAGSQEPTIWQSPVRF